MRTRLMIPHSSNVLYFQTLQKINNSDVTRLPKELYVELADPFQAMLSPSSESELWYSGVLCMKLVAAF